MIDDVIELYKEEKRIFRRYKLINYFAITWVS